MGEVGTHKAVPDPNQQCELMNTELAKRSSTFLCALKILRRVSEFFSGGLLGSSLRGTTPATTRRPSSEKSMTSAAWGHATGQDEVNKVRAKTDNGGEGAIIVRIATLILYDAGSIHKRFLHPSQAMLLRKSLAVGTVEEEELWSSTLSTRWVTSASVHARLN